MAPHASFCQVGSIYPFSSETLAHLQNLGFTGLKSFGQLARLIINQAYMLAINDIFWLSGWIFLCLLFLVWLAKPPFLQKSHIHVE